MSVIRSFCISFSIYSGIPMPQFDWEEEDMRYTLCFFPWVGAVIGALIWGWMRLCVHFGVGQMAYVCGAVAIPLLVTGGFHADGFMDTMDAFRSFRPKEEKLMILKDAHIGAFSVLMLGLCGLVYMAGFSEIETQPALAVFCLAFFLTRILSGLGVVLFHPAGETGLLHTFADRSDRRVVIVSLLVQLAFCVGWMAFLNPILCAVAVGTAGVAFGYYRYKSGKELGGITGDTAGWFVTYTEALLAVALAVASHLG